MDDEAEILSTEPIETRRSADADLRPLGYNARYRLGIDDDVPLAADIRVWPRPEKKG